MRKYELAANLIFQLPLLTILGVAIATAWPLNFAIVVVIYACGVIDLAYAKMPQIRHGIINSFGPSLIPTERRSAYFRAYRRLTFGFAIHCLALVHYFVMIAP